MMAAREITEQEVQAAIEKGELEFTRIDEKGRGAEYTNSIELKDNFPRKIMVDNNLRQMQTGNEGSKTETVRIRR